MYRVRDDRVRELTTVPQSDTGAPLPAVVADESNLSLIYVISEPDPDWDGTYVNVLGADTEGLPLAVLNFERVYNHRFGPPNDEAIAGHPLYERGLQAYGAYTVEASSWIRECEEMNAVHERHQPGFLADYQHFILTFHDSVFECIAHSVRSTRQRGTLRATLSKVP